MARPTKYTEELGDEIAELIANNKTLDQIAQETRLSKRTLINWLRNEDFCTKCARARTVQAHVIDDEIAQVIADVRSGLLTPEQGRVILSGLQWRAVKKDPKTYGERQILQGDKDADPVQVALSERLTRAIENRNKIND